MVLTRRDLTQKQCYSIRMKKSHMAIQTLPQKLDTGRKGDGSGGSWDIRGERDIASPLALCQKQSLCSR